MNNPVTAYTALVLAVKELGRMIDTSEAIRYEPSPGYRASPPSSGVANPTLDTILDPRRAAVSDASAALTRTMHAATRHINVSAEALLAAIAGWEGTEAPGGK